MIGIHPVHRRLAELELVQRKRRWTQTEILEVQHCLRVNANLVRRLDELKQLAFHAYEMGDMDWHNDLCRQIDEVEATMI